MSIEKEIVDYKENKKDVQHWVKLKGEFRYEKIINFLKSKDIKCTWENISNYIRYDKRILINSFKYIVFLEELYKSLIFEYKKIDKEELLTFRFNKSLDEYLSIGDKANYDDIDLVIISKYKNPVIYFRNAIAHNKILLGSTFDDLNLEDVLKIFIKILPKSYRHGFVKDINECAYGLIDKTWKIELNV